MASKTMLRVATGGCFYVKKNSFDPQAVTQA